MGEAVGHFDRLNTLVDSGLLGDLTETELKVLIVYLRHAGADGVAWPSNATLAARLGHGSQTAARRARQSLVDRHLLERIGDSDGGAPTDTARFRIAIPCADSAQGAARPCADSAQGPDRKPCADSAHASDRRMPQIGAPPCADSAQDPAPIRRSAYKAEQHREGHIEQITPPTYPAGMVKFWNACPPTARERSSKAQVLREWKRQRLEPQASLIIASLERWKQSQKWIKDGGEYIEGAHRFLKERKFDEQPVAATTRNGASHGRPGATRPGEYPATSNEIPVFDAFKNRGDSQAGTEGAGDAVPAAPIRATG
jgi:hypothetical protein